MQIDSALVCKEDAIAVWRRSPGGAWSKLGQVRISEPGRDSILTALCAELVEAADGHPQTKLVLPAEDVIAIPVGGDARAALAERGLDPGAELLWDQGGTVAVAQETLRIARRFFRSKGIAPVAITAPAEGVADGEAVFEGPAGAAAAAPARSMPKPAPPAPQPLPKAPMPERPALAAVTAPAPDIVELPQFAARKRPPLPRNLAIGGALAVVGALALTVWLPGNGPAPEQVAEAPAAPPVIATAPEVPAMGNDTPELREAAAPTAAPEQLAALPQTAPPEPATPPADPAIAPDLPPPQIAPETDVAARDNSEPPAPPVLADAGTAPPADAEPATAEPPATIVFVPAAIITDVPEDALHPAARPPLSDISVALASPSLGVFRPEDQPDAPPEVATRLDTGTVDLPALSMRPLPTPLLPEAAELAPPADIADTDSPPDTDPDLAGTDGAAPVVTIRPVARAPGIVPEPVDDAAAPDDLASDDPAAIALAPRPPGRPADLARQIERRREAAAAMTPAATPPGQPAPQPAAAPPAPQPAAAPQVPQTASVASAATEENELRLNRLSLIGVFGSASSRAALVRAGNGRISRVTVNDPLDGGRVVAIDTTSVRYVKNGRTRVLELP